MSNLGLDSSNLLFLAGIVLLTFTLVRLIRRRYAARALEPVTPTRTKGEAIVPSVGEYEVRLYQTFRELNARLETKIAVLDALIEEAQRKIDELNTLAPPSPDGPRVVTMAIDRDDRRQKQEIERPAQFPPRPVA